MDSIVYMESKLKDLADQECTCTDESMDRCRSCKAAGILNEVAGTIRYGYRELITHPQEES